MSVSDAVSSADTDYVVGSRYLKNATEYVHWKSILRLAFTEWYAGQEAQATMARKMRDANAMATLYPDFFHEVRTASGEAIAYLNTVPAYWSGHVESLQDLDYYLDGLAVSRHKRLLRWWYMLAVERLKAPGLFRRTTSRLRNENLPSANCIVLVSIVVDPRFQKQQMPSRLLTAVQNTARSLGMEYVIAPFRPNGYGKFKVDRGVAHSDALFQEYCALENNDGLPIDPWMRVLTRNGVQFLKIEPRSFRVRGSIERFERFRSEFKADSWYSPAQDTWECGETMTWYLDRFRSTVLSVESNIWGMIRLGENAATLEHG